MSQTSTPDEQDARTIELTPLSPQAFAPFGEIISLEHTPKLPIDLYSGANAIHGPVVLQADERPEFILFRVGYRGGEIRYLERHHAMTQTFIPLGNDPYILTVAPPEADIIDGFPDPSTIRAFKIPGDVSINIHRGTWHEPPFPTTDGQKFLLTSIPSVTIGLQTTVDENSEVHELDVDKRSPTYRLGHRLHVRMP